MYGLSLGETDDEEAAYVPCTYLFIRVCIYMDDGS